MFALVALGTLLFTLWVFGDLVIEFACRLAGVFVCVSLTSAIQRSIALALVAGEVIEAKWLAENLAAAITCLLARSVLVRIRKCLVVEGGVEGLADAFVVLLDTFPHGPHRGNGIRVCNCLLWING